MRLICPNCAAQYEVDETAIPETGRDVQCSNCGNAWFQQGKYHLDEADAAGAAPAPEPLITETDEDDLELIQALSEDPDIPGKAPALAVDEGGEASAGAAVPERRLTADPAMMDLLREEAEREARARRAEGISPLETQPEFGLSGAAEGMAAALSAAASAASDERVAQTGPEADTPSESADDMHAQRGARRELLPDIEMINSTLSAAPGRAGAATADSASAEDLARRKSGFRIGFSFSVLVAALALSAYILAPAIAQRIPALEPTLQSYVASVNAARQWIDDKMKSSTEALRGSGEAPPATN